MKGKLQVASVRQIWCDILPALWQMEQCGSQTARVLGIWSESKQGALSLTRCGEVQGGVGCGFRVGYCTMRELHQPQRWKDEAGSRVYCLQQTDISLQMISQSTSDKTPPDFIRRWQDSHCTFALCLFSVPLWFQTSKIAQTQMFFFFSNQVALKPGKTACSFPVSGCCWGPGCQYAGWWSQWGE